MEKPEKNAKGFVYQFTPQEFFYFWFKKKICPRCGGKMTKRKCCEIVNGRPFRSPTSNVPLGLYDVKHYYYLFTCTDCASEFPLDQLAKQKTY